MSVIQLQLHGAVFSSPTTTPLNVINVSLYNVGCARNSFKIESERYRKIERSRQKTKFTISDGIVEFWLMKSEILDSVFPVTLFTLRWHTDRHAWTQASSTTHSSSCSVNTMCVKSVYLCCCSIHHWIPPVHPVANSFWLKNTKCDVFYRQKLPNSRQYHQRMIKSVVTSKLMMELGVTAKLEDFMPCLKNIAKKCQTTSLKFIQPSFFKMLNLTCCHCKLAVGNPPDGLVQSAGERKHWVIYLTFWLNLSRANSLSECSV